MLGFRKKASAAFLPVVQIVGWPAAVWLICGFGEAGGTLGRDGRAGRTALRVDVPIPTCGA